MSESRWCRVGLVLVALTLSAAAAALSWSATVGQTSTAYAPRTLENPYLDEISGLETYSDQATVAAALAPAQSGDFAAALERVYAAASAPQAGDLVNCHAVAHEVGRLAAASDQPIEELMRLVGPECNYGFLHSLVKFRLAEIESDDEAAATGQQWCLSLVGEAFTIECLHGLGHAAWARARGDLPQAWERLCASRAQKVRWACATGLSMEWAAAAQNSPLPIVPPATANPLETCTVFGLPEGAECVRYVLRNFLYPDSTLKSERLSEFLAWCASSPLGSDPTGFFEATCVGSLGNAVSPEDMMFAWEALSESSPEARTMFLRFALDVIALRSGRPEVIRVCPDFGLSDRECRRLASQLSDGVALA